MSAAALFSVWAATLLLGSGAWIALAGWPRRAAERWCALGGGWMLGAVLCAMLVRVLAAGDLARALPRVAATAVIAGLMLWMLAWTLHKRMPVAPDTPATWRTTPGNRLWIAFALALLCWRVGLLFEDILLHPILPWDAWAVWLAKAKVWVLAGRIEPSVSFETWIAQSASATRTGVAWLYPELVSWVAVWFAAGVYWIEPLVGLAWLGLGVSLLALQYGNWRALGVRPLLAATGAYALGSLPLFDAHVALGGYADLWVAAVLALGAHAWLRWSLGERRQLAFVALAIVLLPMIKLEGAAWSILLGVACVFRALPRRLQVRRFAIGFVVLVALVLASIALGVSWIGVARRYLDSGRFFDLGQIGSSATALAAALWAQWNWNLLWFVLPAVLVGNFRRWSTSPMTRRMAAFVALPFAVMLGLFLFTTAARYAQSYSAVNRLLLQITPLLVSLLVLAVTTPDRAAKACGADQAGADAPRAAE